MQVSCVEVKRNPRAWVFSKGGHRYGKSVRLRPELAIFVFPVFFFKIRQHAFKAKRSHTVFSKQNTRKMFSTYSPSQHYVYTYVRTLKLVLRGQVKYARTGTYTYRLHVNTWDGH